MGEELPLTSTKGWALLYLLAIEARPVARRWAADLLWGSRGMVNLRQEVARLRRLPGASRWLADGDPLELRASTDLERFRAFLAAGERQAALRLFAGRLLDGFVVRRAEPFHDWLESARARVEDALREALRREAERLEALDDAAAAEGLFRRILSLDPFDEVAHRGVMRALYRRGEVDSALEQFETCRRALAAELGVAPVAETRALAEMMRRWHVPLAPAPPEGAALPLALLRPATLIGREREWRRMEEAWQRGRTIFVRGASGMGKTRLLMDFARSRGRFVLAEGRPGDRHVPYSSAVRTYRRVLEAFPHIEGEMPPWVRHALGILIPGLLEGWDGNGDPRVEGPVSEARFMEGMWWMARRTTELTDVLPTDDAHHYDDASLRIAYMLTARLAEGPERRAPRLVVALRPEEAAAGYAEMIEEQVAGGLADAIDLEPWGARDVTELLERNELPVPQGLPARLVRFTGGVPMYVLETLKDLHARGELRPAAAPRLELPGRARSVVASRLERLSVRARRVAEVLALLEENAELDLLEEVLGFDTATALDAVGELERAQLGVDGRLVHGLVGEAVIERMTRPVRRLLHARLAGALAARDAPPGMVAQQWLAAGRPGRAAPLLLASAESALRRHAPEDAKLRYFQCLWASETPDLRRSALVGLARAADRLGDRAIRHAVALQLEGVPGTG